MTKRLSRLYIIALVVCGLTFYFSCTQPEDILTSVTRTDLFLRAQLLPTNPEGMIYELWATDGTDTVSLGKFGYHQFWQTYHDENGNTRPDSNQFILDGDILSYSQIFVSVEVNPDTNLASPGPIMLIDDVTLPSNNLIELKFPLNDTFTTTVAFFNMETPSDTDMTLNDGYGIWFSVYTQEQDSVRDTLSLDSVVLAYKELTKEDCECEDTTTTFVENIVNIVVKETTRVFGLDLYTDTIVRFESIMGVDDSVPWKEMDEQATIFFYTISPVVDTFDYDHFFQFDFGLPDYTDYGWRYKGWVVSPEVPVDAVGKITLPAYEVNTNAYDSLIPGVEGGILSTGTFSQVALSDDGNPFSVGDPGQQRVPSFPGEDFLKDLPGGLSLPSWGGLMPYETGNSGTVFITLEPVNFVTDTTNFPLLVYVKPIPEDRADLEDYTVDYNKFMMKPQYQTNDPNSRGFPKITVDIRRF